MATRARVASRSRNPRATGLAPAPRTAADGNFLIVGVGASAGGLDVFRRLLTDLPVGSGLALVLVQHLEPSRASLLCETLAQSTGMTVAQAAHGVLVEPDHVYVIAPGTSLSIAEGVLQVSAIEPDEKRPHLPIDGFLRSLAHERGRQAVGVVLSGSGADGTAGLRAIQAQGGLTFAQDPRTARFSEMPRSAIDAGVVDVTLALPALAAELVRLGRNPEQARLAPAPTTREEATFQAQVVAQLREATGVDFGEHKPGTFQRRLARRMSLRLVEGAAYLDLLRSEPAEAAALAEDLLVKVTSFFRDEEAFEAVATVALPAILSHKAPGAPIRVWVIGCATGEEVYSLAMTLVERLGGAAAAHPILIFGSDLSEDAIATARAALYPDDAVEGLTAERRSRFFVRTEHGWRVSQAVRDLCVFARHDVARDPPFSRLDLVSCRNVLIYFRPPLQRRVLAMAHYGLLQPGFLLLGRSESAAGVPRWFTSASAAGHLFARRPGRSNFRFSPAPGGLPADRKLAATVAGPPHPERDLARQVDGLVLARYGPPGVVVNERLEVLAFRGRTGDYLEQPDGEPQSLLVQLARGGLAAPLRLALARARKSSAPVRTDRVTFGVGRCCDIVVLPVAPGPDGEHTYVVLFEARPSEPAAPRGGRGVQARARPRLAAELEASRAALADLLETHRQGEDAVTVAHDELVSANEELQSLNEEMETAKEELQASNEELTTVNDELHGRNQELNVVNADLVNLLDAVEIPILIIDEQRRIRRITRRAEAVLGLAPADLGRRLTEVALPLQAPDLGQWITRAMEVKVLVEAEVQDRDDRWYRLQIRPHHASDGRVDGATLALMDVDDLRHEIVNAEWARDYARAIVQAVQLPLLVLDAGLRVLSGNAAFYRRFQVEPGGTEGRSFFDLAGGAWNTPELRRSTADVLAGRGRFASSVTEHLFPGAGLRATLVTGGAVASPADGVMVVLAIEDVTERLALERHRTEALALADAARRRAERSDAAKDLVLANLSHELRTPLTTILLQAGVLRQGQAAPALVARAAAAIEGATRRQVQMVEDLLDVSRAIAGKLTLELAPVDWRALVAGVVDGAMPLAESRRVALALVPGDGSPGCLGDAGRLQQVVLNLVSNAIKFTPEGGRVELKVDAADGLARLVVADTGRGISADFLPHLFERFAQEPSESGHHTGLGLGLAIAQDLIGLHGGTLQAESPGKGQGATFTIRLPLHDLPAVVPDSEPPPP